VNRTSYVYVSRLSETVFFAVMVDHSSLIYVIWLVGAMVARGPPKTEVEGSSPLLVVSLSFS
jgi:hypothetical protein